MHRYEELEQIYYKKKYKQIGIIVALLFVFGIIFLVVFIKSDKTTTKTHKKEIKSVIKKTEKNITSINTKQKLSLNPILPKIPITETEIDKKPPVKHTTEKKEKHIIKKVEKKIEKKVEKKPVQVKKVEPKREKKEIKKEQKPKIIIQEEKPLVIKKRKVDVDGLVTLYEKNPNYNMAIKIANMYYEKENYSQSIEWSRKANKLDAEDYQSWLIFAKSLIKIRELNKATEVLQTYMDTYGPEEHIQSLLRSLE